MKEKIYLDYHATTPTDPQVLQQMLPYFYERFGNAASPHPWGWEAGEAVELARSQVANCLGCETEEVIFTAGATEASHLALIGLYDQYSDQARHLITSNVEHKSIPSICQRLVERGAELTILEADSEGRVSAAQVAAALRPDTLFVSLIHANNEIGSINPSAEIAALCRDKAVFFHTDAVQAIGKIPFHFSQIDADLVSLTAHKFYGPKGAGVLIARKKNKALRLKPYLVGGGHEGGRRSGTLNVPAIVGLGAAMEMAYANLAEESARCQKLRDLLLEHLTEICNRQQIRFHVNGPKDSRLKLPHNLSLSFDNLATARVKALLPHVACSSGSACSSANPEPSPILTAIGLDHKLASNSLRFSVGRYTTEAQIEAFAADWEEALKQLK